MAKVQVEIGSWLSERLSPEHPRRLVLEEEVEEGQALKTFLDRLAAKHKAFGEVVFNRESQKLYNHILVIVNGRLMRSPMEMRLRDGDRIAFYPVYAGG